MHKTSIKKGAIWVAVVLLCISAVLYFHSQTLQDQLSENTTRTLKEISEQSATILNNEVNAELQLLGEVASRINRRGEGLSVDKMMDALVTIAPRYQFKEMGIMMPDGTTYNTNGSIINLSYAVQKYEKVFHGESIISDRIQDSVDGVQIILYACPIVQDGKVEAMLFASYTVDDFKQVLAIDTFGGMGYSYVVKPNGDKVVGSNHPKSFKEFTNILTAIDEADASNAQVWVDLRNAMEANETGHVQFFNKESKYLQYTPLDVNDWYLLSVVPTQVVDASANQIMNNTFFVCTVTIAMAGAAMMFFFRVKKRDSLRYDRLLYVDSVTGGDSYAKFVRSIGPDLIENQRDISIIALELMNMDLLRDRFGSDKADQVLKFVYDLVKASAGAGSIVARVTGSEFIILSLGMPKEDIIPKLDKLYQQITMPPPEVIIGMILQPVMGIYTMDGSTTDIIRMQNLASIAKQSAINTPGFYYAFYDEVYRNNLLYNKQMADAMVLAKQNNEFVAHFQPKYDAATKQVIGAEALVRWKKADGTMIYPNDFIPIAENNGFIVQIDKMMFNWACAYQRQLIDSGITPVPISVNVSRKVLYDRSFIDEFVAATEKNRIPRSLIELELTESTLFSDQAEFVGVIEELRHKGFKILVDDFGVGYSSLMMLKSVAVDAIKLDKSFIDDYQDVKGASIITSMIDMVKKLEIPITAEGVETEAQYHFLRDMHCDAIQGYYFARPMPFDAYMSCLKQAMDGPRGDA